LRLILTDTARADLAEIYDHIKQDSPAAAKAFVTDLTEKLFSLAQKGVTGSSRDWISMNLRAFPYRERCFYFRIIDGAMIVVRILHGKQDVTAQEFPYNSEP
jgi:toxin ParE1/3/4